MLPALHLTGSAGEAAERERAGRGFKTNVPPSAGGTRHLSYCFRLRLSRKSVLSGAVKTIPGMGLRFIPCDRDQSFLMPPDLRDWLPENHLVWFVLAAVEDMDLWPFYAAHRVDGKSRPAYEPAMMVALLLYAYARGMRSSRMIERACVEDLAFRVVAAQQRPGSRDDRAVHRAPRERDRGAVRRGAAALRAVGAGQRRRHRDRRHEGPCQRQPRRQPRLRAARARDHRRGQGRRRRRGPNSTATPAATNCPRRRRPRKAGAGGCARPSGAWRPSAAARRSRSRARGPSASRKPSAVSRRSCSPRLERTLPTRPTGLGTG